MAKFTGNMPNAYPGATILCEPAQSTCIWTCHKRHSVRKFTGKMPNAYPGSSILCEPAQSTCTWTCHKRHCVQKFKGKCRTYIPGPPFCASLRNRNAHRHVTRGIPCEIYRENAKHVSRGHHFVPACAVDMHMDMSQEAFFAEIYRENAKRESRGQHFVRACTVDMHMDMSQEAFCAEIKKKGTRIHGPPICASLRSRHAHGHVTQEVLRAEIYTENAKRFRYHLD